MCKNLPALFLLLIINFIFIPRSTLALTINELSSNNGTDWVELYNNSDEQINLSQFYLADGSASGNKKTFNCILNPHGFVTVDWSTDLNNDGDIIRLKQAETIVNCIAYGNGTVCDGNQNLKKLETGEYASRETDGSEAWIIKTQHTKENPNDGNTRAPDAICLVPSPMPTPTPTPPNSPTPTRTPTPTNSPTATKEPTATKSPTSTKTPTPAASSNSPTTKPTTTSSTITSTPKVTLSSEDSVAPLQVLGSSESSSLESYDGESIPTESNEYESSVSSSGKPSSLTPALFILVGGILLIASGVSWMYIKNKKL